MNAPAAGLKRVLMLHTGGTLGMGGRSPQALKPEAYSHQLLQHVPELARLARVDVEIPFNLDSSNMAPQQWTALGNRIHQAREEYDGFVVIHGTDTMAYTASACALMLRPLAQPVVFTGSQRPLGEVRSDARSNLVGAVEMATQDIPEVGVFFDSQLLRGVRTVKCDVWQYDAFASPNCAPLAVAGVDLNVASHVRPRGVGTPVCEDGFEENVACVELHPGFNPAYLDALVQAGVKGVVLRAFGSGNVPTLGRPIPPAVDRAVRAGVAVVVVTQVWRGGVNLGLYECGQKVLEAGAVDGGDLTTAAAVVKLMWALRHSQGVAGVRALFAQELCGEGGAGHSPKGDATTVPHP